MPRAQTMGGAAPISKYFCVYLNYRHLFRIRKQKTKLYHFTFKTYSSYHFNIDGSELYNEIFDCKMLLISREDVRPKTPIDLLTFIISYGDDVFPNLRIALQILLTISVSIASYERSFSKLKLIMSFLRAKMQQDRLSDLTLLSIENETFDKIVFNDIIDDFAAKSKKNTPLKCVF